jgi:hypothetical protein
MKFIINQNTSLDLKFVYRLEFGMLIWMLMSIST